MVDVRFVWFGDLCSPIYRCDISRRVYIPGDRQGAARHPGTLRAVRRHTDYALARRAVLRDLERGRVTRLDVCDAHPELLRAGRHLGEPAPFACPVCEARSLRYVSYVYGNDLRQANGRAITNASELERLDASARRVRAVRRRGVPRVPVEPPHPARAPRPSVRCRAEATPTVAARARGGARRSLAPSHGGRRREC